MSGAVTKDLIDISVADSTTGWSATSDGLDDEVYKQDGSGTGGAYTYQTGKNGIETCTFTPASNINMTANYSTPHLYWTMRCDVFPFCEALNIGPTNSGLMIKVTDGSGNYKQWHIAGSDTWDGSWRTFVLDLTNTANVHSSSGTLSLADVDEIAFITDNSNSGTIRIIDNTWLDAVRYGDGLIANSVTAEAFDFTDIADIDTAVANYYGVLQEVDGVLFCQGKLTIGDATDTNDTNFVSSNETVYFRDQIVSSSHYGIVGVEATSAANPTDIDISGLVVKTVGSTGAEIDFSDTDINSLVIDGSTFLDMGIINLATGIIDNSKFSGCGSTTLGSGVTATGCTWLQSGQISGGSLDACTVVKSTASSAVLSTDLDLIDGCHFIGDGTGHAIELNVSASDTYNWNSTFDTSTYVTSDGSTGNETIYVNDSNGTHTYTIAVAAGATTPTIRTAGATVIVNSDKTVTFKGLKDLTEVRIYKSSDGSVVDGIENATAGTIDNRTFAWSAPAALEVDYVLHNYNPSGPDYETIRVNGYVVPASDTDIVVQQRIDRNSV